MMCRSADRADLLGGQAAARHAHGAKLALKLNEHNNGYMAMGRYAVWTSEVNKNDKAT